MSEINHDKINSIFNEAMDQAAESKRAADEISEKTNIRLAEIRKEESKARARQEKISGAVRVVRLGLVVAAVSFAVVTVKNINDKLDNINEK